MPAIYAHDSFGRSVVSYLPPSFSEFYQKYPEAFRLGFQGPDILFYHKPLKSNPIKKRGMALHVDAAGGDFFHLQAQRLLQNAQKNGNEKVRLEDIFTANGADAAYIAGFLCHFTLDVHCHPTIDGHSEGTLTHGRIESEFDKYVRKQDGVKLRGYNVAKDCIQGENGCAEAISRALNTPLENIRASIKTMRKINGMFTTRCAPFHGLAHGVLKMIGMERKFGDMFMHKKDDPRCADLCPALYEKLQGAIQRAAALIERYFTQLSLFATVKPQQLDDIFRYAYNGIIYTEEKP